MCHLQTCVTHSQYIAGQGRKLDVLGPWRHCSTSHLFHDCHFSFGSGFFNSCADPSFWLVSPATVCVPSSCSSMDTEAPRSLGGCLCRHLVLVLTLAEVPAHPLLCPTSHCACCFGRNCTCSSVPQLEPVFHFPLSLC